MAIYMTVSHEIQPCPPALSNCSTVRKGTKVHLVAYLERREGAQRQRREPPADDGKILDGTAVVNILWNIL